MTKNTPFFPILHVFAPLNDVRAYSVWSWKTTLITWIFGRAWYPLDIRVTPLKSCSVTKKLPKTPIFEFLIKNYEFVSSDFYYLLKSLTLNLIRFFSDLHHIFVWSWSALHPILIRSSTNLYCILIFSTQSCSTFRPILVRFPSDLDHLFIRSWSDFHLILIRFSSNLDQILIWCWSDIHPIFIRFSSNLDQILNCFWSDLHPIFDWLQMKLGS